MRPPCKFFLQGRCQRGVHCKYSHSGTPLPLATAIKQPPTVHEFIPDTVTAIWRGDSVKATFGDGLEPLHLDVEYVDSNSPHVVSIEKQLRITWYKPSRTISLRFSDQQGAERAQAALDKKGIRNTDGKGMLTRQEGGEFRLIVTGVRPELTKNEIQKVLPADAQPKASFFHTPTYESEIAGVAEVRKLIQEHIPSRIVREEDCVRKHDFKMCKAFFFDGYADVEGVATKLNGLKVKALGSTRIWAARLISLDIAMKASEIEAVRSDYKQLCADLWTKDKVKTRAGISGNESLVSVHTFERDKLPAVKARLLELFRRRHGEKLGVSGGDGITNVKFAKRLDETQVHRLRLTKTAVYKEAKKNVDQAIAKWGAAVVSLDDESEPPAVVVVGDTATLRSVQKCIRGDRPTPKSKAVACKICYDDDSDHWVKLEGCGHTACVDCVTQYCLTNPGDGVGREFPLRCFESECNQPLALRQVHCLLDEAQLESLLKQSVQNSIRKRPDKFGHCPGKDCSKTYEKSEKPQACRSCHECLVDFCAKCGTEYHYGMLCDEYQERVVAGEQALERYIVQIGAKRCPSCTAVVEKIEGCNNIACPSCKAHFCWKCLEVKDTHERVYQHLISEHGGYYDNEGDAWDAIVGNMDPAEAIANGLLGGGGGQIPGEPANAAAAFADAQQAALALVRNMDAVARDPAARFLRERVNNLRLGAEPRQQGADLAGLHLPGDGLPGFGHGNFGMAALRQRLRVAVEDLHRPPPPPGEDQEGARQG